MAGVEFLWLPLTEAKLNSGFKVPWPCCIQKAGAELGQTRGDRPASQAVQPLVGGTLECETSD